MCRLHPVVFGRIDEVVGTKRNVDRLFGVQIVISKDQAMRAIWILVVPFEHGSNELTRPSNYLDRPVSLFNRVLRLKRWRTQERDQRHAPPGPQIVPAHRHPPRVVHTY